MTLPEGYVSRINQEVYDQMVNEILLSEELEELGIVVSKEELAEILKSIPNTTGPVVIDVPLDYSDNIKLAEKLLPEEFY